LLGARGSGGFSRVFRAWDRQLEQPVALKVVGTVSDSALRQRLRREVRLLRTARHPHLVRGFDLIENGQVMGCSRYSQLALIPK
jgi:serine/threonine protein kinase